MGSVCSRISDLCLEPRGLRAMRGFAAGPPAVVAVLDGEGWCPLVPAPVRPEPRRSRLFVCVQRRKRSRLAIDLRALLFGKPACPDDPSAWVGRGGRGGSMARFPFHVGCPVGSGVGILDLFGVARGRPVSLDEEHPEVRAMVSADPTEVSPRTGRTFSRRQPEVVGKVSARRGVGRYVSSLDEECRGRQGDGLGDGAWPSDGVFWPFLCSHVPQLTFRRAGLFSASPRRERKARTEKPRSHRSRSVSGGYRGSKGGGPPRSRRIPRMALIRMMRVVTHRSAAGAGPSELAAPIGFMGTAGVPSRLLASRDASVSTTADLFPRGCERSGARAGDGRDIARGPSCGSQQ